MDDEELEHHFDPMEQSVPQEELDQELFEEQEKADREADQIKIDELTK